ncbi:hypothetical protein GDO78_008834 [Eleutherodactylus coqui]|uniref:Sperm-associated antigen 5 n=1 Tax=Eleutherodactylus coqui TaxID=57060 RepID=A0A8J6FE42_ELECQ|nr:hypothetical protein GDO78_008834 [Eleutherodactylus coqui]
MWSPDAPVSDENQIPHVQNVYHQSVGQTSSKVLTGPKFAVLDLNTLVHKRSSPSKPSNHSAFINMKSTRVGAGTPGGVWIDPCRTDILTESSETEANTSKKQLFSSLVETKVSEGDLDTLSTCPENNDQFSQSCNIAVLPQSIDSSDSQTASSDHKDNHRWSLKQVGHSQHMKGDELIHLPSAINTNELPELWIFPALGDDTCRKVSLTSDDPESGNDTYDVLVPGRPCRHGIELGEIQLQNLDSKDEDNAVNDPDPDALHISKQEILLPTMRNDSLVEDLLPTNQKFDYAEEPNAVTSTNTSYEIDPFLNAASEQSSGIGIDELSEVTEVIANWNLSIKDHDYFQYKSADDEGNDEGCPQIEKSWSSAGMMMNDLSELQLLTGSPEKLGPVLDHYEGYLPDALPIKSYLLTELVYRDPAISPLCNPRFYTKKRTNKCCTPVIRATTDNILNEGDSTPLTTHAGCFSHISKMDQEAGTSMTPVSTTEGVTWMTPMMLLNKSMNTSFIELGKKSAKDNSSETDSLLWSFSKEALCNATQQELLDRLEGTLIVIEVLSRQLQGWQENKVSCKPSEQRECATQTCVTYSSTEEQYYHRLYLKTLSQLQSVQRSQREERMLLQHLKVATDALISHKDEASSAIEFANSLYEVALKDRADLKQKMTHTRKLLGDHMCFLEKMSKKGKECLLQRDEMRDCMEKAIEAKDAADMCLQDLEIHSSAAITQLRRDLESERLLCESVKEAYKEQRSYNEEVAEFVGRAQSVSSQVEEDRTQLQRQCSQAKELMSRYRHLFDVMKEKTQSALEQYEGIVMERDVAVLENEKLCGYLESMNSQTEQMKLENSRLGSELESLMGTLCTRKVEIEQLKEEKLELEDLLSAKNTSMKLLEKELDEATARGHEYQDRIKHLVEQISVLKSDLSETLNQKQDLQKRLEMVANEHASQITYYTESLEFLEQENSVCREQVTEVESQLRTHHRTVLERNFQCEDLKDTIKDLQKEVNDSQEKLSHSQKEVQSRMMKLNKDISDSFMEIFKIKSQMLELIENLREDTKSEAIQCLPKSQTPGRSLVPSKDEELMTTNISAADLKDQREGIGSKTSAFTLVHPVSSPSAGSPQDHLPVVVNELSGIVADVISTSSSAIERKQQTIQDLRMQISSLKEELQNLTFQHTSEVRMLQEEVGNLKRRNSILDQKTNSKEKCISELQEVVNQQEQKILQQFSKSKESEVLIQENAALQLSLKVCEKEVEVLKKELAQNSTEAARNWIQEKLLLHKDLTTLGQKLVDTEYSKSEAIQRLLRHKDILKANQSHSDAEVKKLDNMIVRIRQDLLSIPEVVNNCDKLRQLVDFLNYGSRSEETNQ